ncbi:uncharacterized protein PFLUO_LOCUS662 [Penicillium psychrofluorescens]|uniref:uncharacterized protein n=1 Tax=Penicillium psychrofluorescens TaxID=3158075 RepID=UPI003CCD13E5
MGTLFPPWPNVLFGVLEPISLALGSLYPLHDLEGFIAGQTPKAATAPIFHPSSMALAYQLGNLYSLLFLVGVAVMYSTNEPRVLRNYAVALAIADIGHVYATYLAMGWEAFVDVTAWNALTWGNIGVTGFLFVNRIAYLCGLFGPTRAPKAAGKKA